MKRFNCPECHKNQYSANEDEQACIYCGNPTEVQDKLEEDTTVT